MNTYRISDERRAKGMCWCDMCRREGKGKIRAEWHQPFTGNMCEEHKRKNDERERYESGRVTLADEMTWMKL